ncbi:uncharacterized protein [Palaemon carinicauda]|uniref:uncharacterized protein n=1 Tax=Palaemon carinicauda TaxID=392227 RepID=UPI0035B60F71
MSHRRLYVGGCRPFDPLRETESVEATQTEVVDQEVVVIKAAKEVGVYILSSNNEDILVIDAVVQPLEKGLQIAAYLERLASVSSISKFLQSLGFQINLKKSRLAPAQVFQWLGIHWILQSHSLSIPASKRKEIARMQDDFGNGKPPQLSATIRKRPWGYFEGNFDRGLLPKSFKDNTAALSSSGSDSSYGRLIVRLGGHTPLKKVQGGWSQKCQQFHINNLEAMAVFWSLKKLHLKKNIHISLVLDKKVIVHCINRPESWSPQINHVMFAFFTLSQRKRWHMSASHFHGVRNVMADYISRTHHLKKEWSLDGKFFSFGQDQVPGLQRDLIPTSLNRKLPCYVAPNMAPAAVSRDAMNLDWNQCERIYLFPPFNLLIKVLDKL